MRIRSLFAFTVLAAVSFLSGCAVSPQAEVKYEPLAREARFDVRYFAQLGPVSVDLGKLVPEHENARESEQLVAIETRLLEMPRESAAEVLGIRSSTEAVAVETTRVTELVEALQVSKTASCISAPRLTCYDLQRANISVLNQVAYVASYEVSDKDGARTADPVIEVVHDGLVLAVRPRIGQDGIELELTLVSSELQKPIAELPVELPQGQKATIQTPSLYVQKLETKAHVKDGGTLMISALRVDGEKVNVLLVTARIVAMDEVRPK